MSSIRRLYAGHRIWRTTDKNKPADAVDISAGSRWATPFTTGRDGTRQDIVDQFDKWLLHAPDRRARWMRSHLGELAGHDLACTCSPDFCHGGILLTMASLETCHPDYQEETAGVWLRLVATENGTLSRYLIQVTDTGPTGTVIDAVGRARWMIGNPCSAIGTWLRNRDGSAMELERAYELARAVSVKEAIAS